MKKLALLLCLVPSLAFAAVAITPSTTTCTHTITQADANAFYTINGPGTYCLVSNLTVAVNKVPIIVAAGANDDVVVDFGGFTLSGSGASAGVEIGIVAASGRTVTIRNGVINNFGDKGIYIWNNNGGGIVNGLVLEDFVVNNSNYGLYVEDSSLAAFLVAHRCEFTNDVTAGVYLSGVNSYNAVINDNDFIASGTGSGGAALNIPAANSLSQALVEHNRFVLGSGAAGPHALEGNNLAAAQLMIRGNGSIGYQNPAFHVPAGSIITGYQNDHNP